VGLVAALWGILLYDSSGREDVTLVPCVSCELSWETSSCADLSRPQLQLYSASGKERLGACTRQSLL
jgi:hypothetical protein